MAAEGCNCRENGLVTMKETKCICSNCEMFKRKYSAAEQTNSNKSVLIDMLQQELKKKENLYKDMIDEYEKLRFKHCSVVQELEDMKEVYRRMEDENSRLLKEKEIGKRHQKELISTLKEELDEWKKQFKDLQHRIQPSNDLNHKIERIEKLLQNQGITMIELVKKFLGEIRNVNFNNNVPKYAMGTITNEYGDTNNKIKELEDDNENLNTLVKKLTQENKDIKNRLNEKKQKLSDCICVLEKNENNIKNLSKEIENIIEERNSVSKENLKLKAQIEYLEDKLDEKNDEIKHLNDESTFSDQFSCSQSKEDPENLKKQLVTMKQHNLLLNDTIRILTDENKSNLQVIEDLTMKMNEMSQEKQDAEKAWAEKYNRLTKDLEDSKYKLKKIRRRSVEERVRVNAEDSCNCGNISTRDASPLTDRSPLRKRSLPKTFQDSSQEIDSQIHAQRPPQTPRRFSPSVTPSRKSRQRDMYSKMTSPLRQPRVIPSTPGISICDQICSTKRDISAFDSNLLHAEYRSVESLEKVPGSKESVEDTPSKTKATCWPLRRRKKTKDESTQKKLPEVPGKTSSKKKESDSNKRVAMEKSESEQSQWSLIEGECKNQCAQTPDFPKRRRDVIRDRGTQSCGFSLEEIDDIHSDISFEQMEKHFNQQAAMSPEPLTMKKPLRDLKFFTSERFEDSGGLNASKSIDRISGREDKKCYVSCPVGGSRTFMSCHDLQVHNYIGTEDEVNVHLEPKERPFESVLMDLPDAHIDADDTGSTEDAMKESGTSSQEEFNGDSKVTTSYKNGASCTQLKSKLDFGASNEKIWRAKCDSIAMIKYRGDREKSTIENDSQAEILDQAENDDERVGIPGRRKIKFVTSKDEEDENAPPSDINDNKASAQVNESVQQLVDYGYQPDFGRQRRGTIPMIRTGEFINVSINVSPKTSDRDIEYYIDNDYGPDSDSDKRGIQSQARNSSILRISSSRSEGIDESVQVCLSARHSQDEKEDVTSKLFDNDELDSINKPDSVTEERGTQGQTGVRPSPKTSSARSTGIDEAIQAHPSADELQDEIKEKRLELFDYSVQPDSVTEKRSPEGQTKRRSSPRTSDARSDGIDEAIQVCLSAQHSQDEIEDEASESLLNNGVHIDSETEKRDIQDQTKSKSIPSTSTGIDETTQVSPSQFLKDDDRKGRNGSTPEEPSTTDEFVHNLHDDINPDDYISRSNEKDEDEYQSFSKDGNLMSQYRSRENSVSCPEKQEEYFLEKTVGYPTENQTCDTELDPLKDDMSSIDPKKPRGSSRSSRTPCAECGTQTSPSLLESFAEIQPQTDHQLFEVGDITVPRLESTSSSNMEGDSEPSSTTEEEGKKSQAARMSSLSSETESLGTVQNNVQDSSHEDPKESSSRMIPEKVSNQSEDRLCTADTQVKSCPRTTKTEAIEKNEAVDICIENSEIDIQTSNQFESCSKSSVQDNSCQTEVSMVDKKVGSSIEVLTNGGSLLKTRFNAADNATQTHHPRMRSMSIEVCPMTGENCIQTERILRDMEIPSLRRLSERSSNSTKSNVCTKEHACQVHVPCSEICHQAPTVRPLSQEQSMGIDKVPVRDEELETEEVLSDDKKSSSTSIRNSDPAKKSKIPTLVFKHLRQKCMKTGKTKPDPKSNRENIEEVTKEKDRIIRDLKAKTAILRDVKDDYEKLLKDNKSLEDKLVKLEEKLKEVALERNELLTENETLRKSCSDIGKNNDNVRKQEEAKQGLEKLENLDYDPSGLKLLISTLKDKLQELEQDNCKKSFLILSLETCVDRSNDILGECEKEIRAMLQQNETLKEKNEQLEKSLQFSSGNQYSQDIQDKVSNLMKEYKDLLREATEKDLELEEIKRKYDKLCNSSKSVRNVGTSPRSTQPKKDPSPGKSTVTDQGDNNKKQVLRKKTSTSDLGRQKKCKCSNKTKCKDRCACTEDLPTDSPRSSRNEASPEKTTRKNRSTPTESPRSSQNEGSPEKLTRTNKSSSCGSSCPCGCWKHARSRLRDLDLGKQRKHSQTFVAQMRRCYSKSDSLNSSPGKVESDDSQLIKKEESIKRLHNEKVNLQLKLNSLRFDMNNVMKEHTDLKSGITCLLTEIINKLQIVTNAKSAGSPIMTTSPGDVTKEVLDSLTQLEQSLSAKKSCNCMSVIKSKYLLDQQVIARQMYQPLFNKFFCDHSSESKSNNSSVDVFDIIELEVEKDNAHSSCKR